MEWSTIARILIALVGTAGVAALVLLIILFRRKLMKPMVIILSPLVDFLARRNWFFTMVFEGTAKNIVEGGAFRRVEIQWEGYTLNRDTWDIVEDGGAPIGGKTWREPWHPFGGRRWVGAPWRFRVYSYRLRWSSPREDGNIVPHDEVLPHVLLKDHIFYMKLSEIEDQEMVPIDFGFFVTMRCVNPWRFVFRAQDPLEMMMNRISPYFRQYVGGYVWEDIVKNPQMATKELWKMLAGKEIHLIEELEKEYGIKVISIQIKDIDPHDPEYQRVATSPYRARKEGEGTITREEAQGRASAKRITGFLRGFLGGFK